MIYGAAASTAQEQALEVVIEYSDPKEAGRSSAR